MSLIRNSCRQCQHLLAFYWSGCSQTLEFTMAQFERQKTRGRDAVAFADPRRKAWGVDGGRGALHSQRCGRCTGLPRQSRASYLWSTAWRRSSAARKDVCMANRYSSCRGHMVELSGARQLKSPLSGRMLRIRQRVRPAKSGLFSGRQSHRSKSQNSVT